VVLSAGMRDTPRFATTLSAPAILRAREIRDRFRAVALRASRATRTVRLSRTAAGLYRIEPPDERQTGFRLDGLTGRPEEINFLQQVRKHNDRDCFARREAVYEQFLREPREQLACAGAASCQSRGFALLPKQRAALTRIDRDTRFSPDKRPFHDYVGATLRGRNGVTHAGCLYVQVSPGNSFGPLTPGQLDSPRLVQVVTTFVLQTRPLIEIGWSLGYRREKPGTGPIYFEPWLPVSASR
jgi:hypothetical protein